MPVVNVSHYPPGEMEQTPLSPVNLLRVARAFSCFFWGLPLGLLLFVGILKLELSPYFQLPAYVLAVFVIFCGLAFLHRTGIATPLWSRRLRAALVILLAQVYLAPFVYWWRQMPYQTYYTVNMILLLLCTAWQLFVINQLAAEIGSILRDRSIDSEARISAWLCVVFMLIPTVNAVLLSLTLQKDGTGLLYIDMALAPFTLPPWLSILAVLPFTLTMAVAWKLKTRCLSMLVGAAQRTAQPVGGIL